MRAEQPFIFKTQLPLVEATGLKAVDLAELSRHLKQVPESSVYHHTHHFLQQHQYLTPEPPNDFAYWITEVLQEDEIGERIAAIDTVRFSTLKTLRYALVATIDNYLQQNPPLRKCPPGEEFFFMKCVLFTLPTEHTAYDLREFRDCLAAVSIHCLYNHIFEGRLRPPLGISDLSSWLKSELGEVRLSDRIEALDPYTRTMEGLRSRIIELIDDRLKEPDGQAG
jgi:hypothetical protein